MSAAPSVVNSIRREFLGWDRPALAEAARRLLVRYREGGTLDLGKVIIVVPGMRASRRLTELLVWQAEDENLLFTPPILITEGKLPEMLYTPKRLFANDVVQDLAWAKALRELPPQQRRHVVPQPPAEDEGLRWLELGKRLRGVHSELAADGLDFAAVVNHVSKLAGFAETERWKALAGIQRLYLTLLDGQELWDKQTARLKAIEFSEICSESDIIVLGAVDLNDTLRLMLEQIAPRVTAYIVAPESLADHFDSHGCLAPSAWCDAHVPILEEQLQQVDGALDQAEAVSEWLEALEGRFRVDEVAIGVPDETLVPQLQRQLEQSGVRARWVEGVRLPETAPFRLLKAAVQFACHRRYEDLAALVRHPDVEDWLGTCTIVGVTNTNNPCHEQSSINSTKNCPASLPAQLDDYYNTHLPSNINIRSLREDLEHWPDLPAAVEKIECWLESAARAYSLSQWGMRFNEILDTVYGNRTLDRDAPDDQVLHGAISRIVEECGRLEAAPEALDSMPFHAVDALQVALAPLANEALPPPADPDAVEILGWLELPLDDSRALIVTSFNEGIVPQSTGADAFLPDRLRCELGILHNERRYARDAYATTVLCKSREHLRLLVARRDTKDQPCQPSRLAFACSDDELLTRARRFYSNQRVPSPPRRLLLAPSKAIPDRSLFAVPTPIPPLQKLQRISVTRFKDYLACPYRYYLRHVRKLEVVDDAARELDGGAFGTLLHEALSALGREPGAPRESTNVQEICDYLQERLETLARRRYGYESRRPSIRLQLEQARLRLRAFAGQQVIVVREGWHIVHAEIAEADEQREGEIAVPFVVDGEPVLLVGRIDRIDFHEQSHTLRILDYKTADAGVAPEKTHRNAEGWIDLQLPLYRHLWQALSVQVGEIAKVDLGYFNLPKQLDKTEVLIADWNDASLQEADELAREVVRKLRKNHFWPPTYPAPKYNECFAGICLDNSVCGPDIADEDQGGPA